MKVTVYMAQSLDGFIARDTGQEDFLSTLNWDTFERLAEETGCFVLGRTTYKTVKQWDNHSYIDVDATRLVVTTNNEYSLDDGYLRATSPKDALEKAKQEGYDEALIIGGPHLNQSFFDTNLVDELIININPVLIGEGKSFLPNDVEDIDLNLRSMNLLRQDILRLRYQVQ